MNNTNESMVKRKILELVSVLMFPYFHRQNKLIKHNKQIKLTTSNDNKINDNSNFMILKNV